MLPEQGDWGHWEELGTMEGLSGGSWGLEEAGSLLETIPLAGVGRNSLASPFLLPYRFFRYLWLGKPSWRPADLGSWHRHVAAFSPHLSEQSGEGRLGHAWPGFSPCHVQPSVCTPCYPKTPGRIDGGTGTASPWGRGLCRFTHLKRKMFLEGRGKAFILNSCPCFPLGEFTQFSHRTSLFPSRKPWKFPFHPLAPKF
ncbi:hypothetical protein VULLAG_LOCUS5659 [Vulpes lagopus]